MLTYTYTYYLYNHIHIYTYVYVYIIIKSEKQKNSAHNTYWLVPKWQNIGNAWMRIGMHEAKNQGTLAKDKAFSDQIQFKIEHFLKCA